MSEQMTDPFRWKLKEYVFIEAEDVYSLFDPEAYGLHPEEPHTACWKGFIIYFSVKRKQLYIDRLDVYCEDNIYPTINGVDAREGQEDFYVYKGLHMPVAYTGTIIIGRKLGKGFRGRAFLGSHSYEITYELDFENGILVDSRETSGTYQGI